MKIFNREDKLNLKNDGKLEIVFIGTGTAFSKTLFNNNMIIIKGDTHILVDFGFNAPVSLSVNTGLSPIDIEVFLPTHSHADHIGGVEYLVLLNRYVGRLAHNKEKLKLITTKEYEKIFWDSSLKGGLEWNEASENGSMVLSDYFDILYANHVENNSRSRYYINFGGIDIELFGTNHIPDSALTQKQAFISYGLMIDNRVMYTSDTKFDQSLLESYADKAEVIFHDCSIAKNPVHSSIDELRLLPGNWKEKIILMHYADNWKKLDAHEFMGFAKEGVRYVFD